MDSVLSVNPSDLWWKKLFSSLTDQQLPSQIQVRGSTKYLPGMLFCGISRWPRGGALPESDGYKAWRGLKHKAPTEALAVTATEFHGNKKMKFSVELLK